MNKLSEITQQYFRTDLPQLAIGDKVEVITKNFDLRAKSENPKYRLTHFLGTVIAQKNKRQISYTFSVLKASSKIARMEKFRKNGENRFEFNFRGREVIFEIDQVARKCDKSILGRYGNTTVLTVLVVKELNKKIDSFFPLIITVEEKFYAVGRIPAQFNKREGKPSYDSVTVARLIDRSLRSFFPLSGNQEVQIINHILSVDPLCDPDERTDQFSGELIISATEEKIVMVEAKIPEISEEKLFSILEKSHQEIGYLIGFFRYIANKKFRRQLIRESEEEITDLVNKIGNNSLKKMLRETTLFTRGDTEVLSIITLGKVSEKQVIDNVFSRSHKHFIHHYNFPNFAVNELISQRGISRREIGHGELVEKTFAYLLPTLDVFPYTIRAVSEVLAADGSSSQAAICATSLALMAAGVPLTRPAAGIALGLLDGQIYTDINGLEDKLGEMDFKIAGTEKGICSLQLDVKNQGISLELLKECLERGQSARIYLLKEMKKHLFAPPPNSTNPNY
ncbi:8739_t:CDS:2 [Racocetra fulgida]|uniref:8739_t:CDS:1 n=1 Tax=Racocetra fulgida TaxID=60492 RepID=A0A9N9ID80_9GLOM|nr:8739_t:CDS:2 [Racocetra fulgida]